MAEKKKEEKIPETAPDAASEAPKKGGLLKLIICVVLGVALGGAGAFFVPKFLGGDSPSASAPQEESAATAEVPAPEAAAEAPAPAAAHGSQGSGAEGGEAAAPVGPQIIELQPPFIVNLNDGTGKRFLKLAMSMKVGDAASAQELDANMPQVRDALLMLLSSLSYEDISTMDGKMRLRGQMLKRANSLMSGDRIQDIYFSEFVIQ